MSGTERAPDGHRYDHDGTWRHHHADPRYWHGEPVWWTNVDEFGGEKRDHRHSERAAPGGLVEALKALRVVSVMTGPGPSVEGYIKADVLAALREAEGLDVDRLAEAICGTRLPFIEEDDDLYVDDACRSWARTAAAEYARLASQETRP